MTYDGIKERYRDIEDEKAKLQHKLDAERLQNSYLSKDQIKWALTKFSNLDTNNVANRRFLIDSFINAIYLYDDGHMDICFNFRGASRRISADSISSTPRPSGSPMPNNPNCNRFGFFNAFITTHSRKNLI
jgi:site-specific DNA recombinase